MAIYANLTVDQGSDFYSIIEVENINGDVLNLDGYQAQGQIRKSYSSTTAINFLANVIDIDKGLLSIALSANQTDSMKAGRYVYDVEIVSAGGSVTRVIEGQLEVNPGVTRV